MGKHVSFEVFEQPTTVRVRASPPLLAVFLEPETRSSCILLGYP